MVKLNREQRVALHKVWARGDVPITYREFRRSVQAGWDCVMVQWCGMWLGIERDGYTHS